MIDLRSDTVTRPTPPMLAAMQAAPVGDDVYEEDPTVRRLEESLAARFGLEAGLFCPSGTMTNQIAIQAHCPPLSEVICEATAHVYLWEVGGIMHHARASVALLPGDRGRLTAAQIEAAIRPAHNVHYPTSRLVCLENTHNRGGGSCYEWADMEAVAALAKRQGLALHLDGARIFNALVATGQRSQDYGRLFDSISVCLSKGLGAPVARCCWARPISSGRASACVNSWAAAGGRPATWPRRASTRWKTTWRAWPTTTAAPLSWPRRCARCPTWPKCWSPKPICSSSAWMKAS